MAKADIKAGGAFVEVYLKNRLAKGLRKASKQLRGFSAGARGIGMKIGAIGAAITGPILGAAAKFASLGDDINKMAIRTGVGAQALTELGHAAELSGASQKQLGDALTRMRRRVANAATGTGPAARAMKELGLNAEELTKLPVEEQFQKLQAAMRGMKNESRANQMAFEVFGDSSKALLPLLHSDAAAMAAMRQEARDLGATLSDEDAQSAADLTDALHRLKKLFSGIVTTVGATVAPMLTDLAGKVTQVGIRVVAFIRDNRSLIVTALKIGVVLSGIASAFLGLSGILAVVGMGLSGAATIVAGLGTVLGAILSPIGAVIAAVAALGYYIAFHTQAGGEAIEWLGNAFKSLLDFVQPIITAIGNALKAKDTELAANIMWTGIELAFRQGSADVTKAWREFATGLQQIFDEAAASITKSSRMLGKHIGESLSKVKTGWRFIAAQVTSGGKADPFKYLKESQDEIAAGAVGAALQMGWDDEYYENREKKRAADLVKALAADKKRLESLKRQLNSLGNKARVMALLELAERSDTKFNQPPPPTMPALGSAQGALRENVRGTFSAHVAGMLGRGGSRDTRLLEMINKNLDKIREEFHRGSVLNPEGTGLFFE